MANHGIFLTGKPHGQPSLVSYSPWDGKRVRQDSVAKLQQQQYDNQKKYKLTKQISLPPSLHVPSSSFSSIPRVHKY